MLNSELKIDMWVVCLPGYNTDEDKGGYGYKEDFIFQCTNTPYNEEGGGGYLIASPGNRDGGVYVRALRPATGWEIKHKQVQKEMNYEIY